MTKDHLSPGQMLALPFGRPFLPRMRASVRKLTSEHLRILLFKLRMGLEGSYHT